MNDMKIDAIRYCLDEIVRNGNDYDIEYGKKAVIDYDALIARVEELERENAELEKEKYEWMDIATRHQKYIAVQKADKEGER